MHLDPAWIAVIGTLCGGVGLKVVEKWLNRSQERRDSRTEFRDEIKDLQNRLDHVENELSTWKDKYYASQEQILTLKAMMIGAGITPPDP